MRQLIDPKIFGRPTIGLARFGCANRPFYHISVFPDPALGRRYEGNIIEQVRKKEYKSFSSSLFRLALLILFQMIEMKNLLQ
jgi:hypothetical protein